VARWTLTALIAAEECGVTSENAEEMAQGTDNPEMNRLLGAEDQLGSMLGLSNE
jgi:general L-amino acid transport system substrate-binding protein